jgi:hypothetical protein
MDSLDQVAAPLAKAVERAAPAESLANEALSGTALGHPLHPPLTDVLIGAWTSAVALDWLGGKRGRLAADRLVALGVLSALPTAAAGLNDWATLDVDPTTRLGARHDQRRGHRTFRDIVACAHPQPTLHVRLSGGKVEVRQ